MILNGDSLCKIDRQMSFRNMNKKIRGKTSGMGGIWLEGKDL